MNALRQPLLAAFAGGCLSSALLFGIWRAVDNAGAPESKQRHRPRGVEVVSVVTAAPSVVQAPSEPAPNAVMERPLPATPDPAPVEAAHQLESAEVAPAGSAVSDVLMGLEAAYRERARAAAAAALAPVASAAPEPAPVAPVQTVAAVVPVAPAVVAAPSPTQVPAPAPVAPPAAVAAYAPPAPPTPSRVHYGDVNQNTYVTNVRQGDVYLMQVQMQQLAMLQYMQLMGMNPGMAAPGMRHLGGGGMPQQQQRFPSGITNPDNPWGFNFAPPNLVR